MATQRNRIIQRIHHHPAVGKNAELQTAVENIVQQEKSNGIRAFLLQKVTWGEGPELVTNSLFANMADYQKYREDTLPSPERTQVRLGTVDIRRRPIRRTLAEGIVHPSTVPAVEQGQYVHMVTIFPAMGKIPEVRAIIEEFAQEYKSTRPRFRVVRNLFVPEGGGSITMADTYASLSEYEEVDMLNRSPLIGQMVAKVAPLCERPQLSEMYEALIGPES